MKKYLMILLSMVCFGISANAQNFNSEQQTIINKLRAEIQQKLSTANEYQKKTDECGSICQRYKNAKDPGEDAKSINLAIAKYCGDQERYQAKANQLRAEAKEDERLLNNAIEKAKKANVNLEPV